MAIESKLLKTFRFLSVGDRLGAHKIVLTLLFFKRKIIIANKASFNGIFIDEGKIGLTGCNKYYIIGDNLELILKMLNFKITDIISHFTKYTQDFLDREAFKYLPDIRKLGINDIDEI